MSGETTSIVPAGLSPRAAIALLTLQLRASVQEAETAEAEAAAVSEEAAREQLRGRLAPLIEERRRALDDALDAVRTEAGDAVRSAREAAAAMIADARAAVVVEPEPIVEPEPEPIVEPEPEIVEPEPVVVQSEVVAPDAVMSMPVGNQMPIQITVGIDAEAFAQAFATVFANMLDDRLGAPGALALRGGLVAAPLPAAARPSFWSHARHLDALLLGFATVIVLVVLAAWLV